MHMADALVTPLVAGAMYVSSGTLLAFCTRKIRSQEDIKKASLMGILGAFVFSTQMINFTIPGTGSSGHFCGALFLAALLGPYAAFLTMAGVLLVQCLLFADGGLIALGCNIWNMGFYGCFIGGYIVWHRITSKKLSRTRIIVASMVGSILSLQLGAFSVVLETLLSGVTELPFNLFIAVMQPIHLAIGVVEGLITATILCFIYQIRPELLWQKDNMQQALLKSKACLTYKSTLTLLGVIALILGGLCSLLASSLPDGLEWSIAKMPHGGELAEESGIYKVADALQSQTALLPDYGFKSSDTLLGTSFSGIIGCLIIITCCFLCCHLLHIYKKHHSKEKVLTPVEKV